MAPALGRQLDGDAVKVIRISVADVVRDILRKYKPKL